jgi:HEPN domain-containing protein
LYSEIGQTVYARRALQAGIRNAVRHGDAAVMDLLKALIRLDGAIVPTEHNVKGFAKIGGGALPTPLNTKTFTRAVERYRR